MCAVGVWPPALAERASRLSARMSAVCEDRARLSAACANWTLPLVWARCSCQVPARIVPVWETNGVPRSTARPFTRNDPAWEKAGCAGSRFGRAPRAQEAQAGDSRTTSRLGRNLPVRHPGLGENATFEQQKSPFLAHRPRLGEIGWNKILLWENIRIAQADYLDKCRDASSLEKVVLSQAETLR